MHVSAIDGVGVTALATAPAAAAAAAATASYIELCWYTTTCSCINRSTGGRRVSTARPVAACCVGAAEDGAACERVRCLPGGCVWLFNLCGYVPTLLKFIWILALLPECVFQWNSARAVRLEDSAT